MESVYSMVDVFLYAFPVSARLDRWLNWVLLELMGREWLNYFPLSIKNGDDDLRRQVSLKASRNTKIAVKEKIHPASRSNIEMVSNRSANAL